MLSRSFTAVNRGRDPAFPLKWLVSLTERIWHYERQGGSSILSRATKEQARSFGRHGVLRQASALMPTYVLMSKSWTENPGLPHFNNEILLWRNG